MNKTGIAQWSKLSFANKKDNNTHHKKENAGFVPSVEFVMASSVAF